MTTEVEKLVNSGKLSEADGEKLTKLPVGSFGQHKSWGVGRIAEWDLIGDRMVIDFEDKAGHAMKISFAVNSLLPLDEAHILALRAADVAALKSLFLNDPVKALTIALKSHSNTLGLDELESLLIPKVFSAAEYKAWWTAAKKALKSQRQFVVPAKRSEKIVLRDEGISPSRALVDDLVGARDLKAKLSAVARVQKDLDLFVGKPDELGAVYDEISISVKKAWKLNLKESLVLLLQRDELFANVSEQFSSSEQFTLEELLTHARRQLTEVVDMIPVGVLNRFYNAFPIAYPNGEWVAECLAHLTRIGGRAVAEIANVLESHGELDQLEVYLKRAVRNRQLSTDLLIWICKERKNAAVGIFDLDLGNAILGALEDDHISDGPKKTARLSDAFTEDLSLLPEMVQDADLDEIFLFGKRILGTSVFDELTRRSLMGRIIKTRPEAQELMDDSSAKVNRALIVSWESMERRKEELQDLIKNKIPQNKKDIQIALGYGDLRENFEYKSARQQQAVLQRLQSKYERELNIAQGTDFAGVSTETVGIGTIVELEDLAGGQKETQTILGAWDGDPDKNILSYLSEMAKVLVGKKAGDEVTLPTDTGGTRQVKIVAIKAYNP